ncbi:MAG: DJ-1/PfpI family protein [Candidatus Berkelbacteria bacterium]|nr:DJ-1/PfpI family protein [Candidatus Berkelbacteria bacterium]
MAKIVMVIAPENFRDEEYFKPKEILESNGHEVITASKEINQIRGVGGGTAKATVKVMDLSPYDYEAIVFIGGQGMQEFTNDSDLKAAAKKFYDAKKLTAAICIAPAILANAGILSGKKVTSTPSAIEVLKKAGSNHTGSLVEVDGQIITASGPDAAEELGNKIAEILKPK